MKKLDIYLIRAFIPPFAVAFAIACFVLIMQFLWLYIDEIMGKGLGIFVMAELIFYLSMTIVPLALPIAILISSVMVMGNLAESYELSSFKSAGVSLLRIMAPLAVIGVCVSLFSIFVSDRVIPWANLKFSSRFYDIRKSRPALTLQEGVFNDEFQDYTLRIGKKGRDGKSLQDVLIYGNKGVNPDLVNQISAKSGEMFTTDDKRYMVMNLFDGTQYQETGTGQNGKRQYPFVRIHFQSWQKIFDLTQFDNIKTDESLFKSNQKMKGAKQLNHDIDSIQTVYQDRIKEFTINNWHNFTPYQTLKVPDPMAGDSSKHSEGVVLHTDSTRTIVYSTTGTQTLKQTIPSGASPDVKNKNISPLSKSVLSTTPTSANKAFTNIAPPAPAPPAKIWANNFYDLEKRVPADEWNGIKDRAASRIRGAINEDQSYIVGLKSIKQSLNKYIYELNSKYGIALICFIFMFIGAPMGAIIQKGGFGFPILIAIVFFLIYYISLILCKNYNEAAKISPYTAAWAPCIVMGIVGVFLTYRAMNDYKMISFDPAKTLNQIRNYFRQKRVVSDADQLPQRP